MLLRIRLLSLLLLLPLVATAPCAAAETPEEAAAEAQRLYDHAQAYVNNITEGDYSYAYLQFYWKRAQANVERVLRLYSNTPVGRQLSGGEVAVGPFTLDYFRERVLPRVEVKRLAAYDAVNCAILLYTLEKDRWDDHRRQAFHSIQEVLVRQRRFREALGFPVPEGEEQAHFLTIFRTAVYDGQTDVVQELLTLAEDSDLPDLQPSLRPILAEGIVLSGQPRTELAAFLDRYPDDEVKLAALSRMVDRELLIQRSAALRLDIRDRIRTTHFQVLNPQVRDNVPETARVFFPQGHPQADLLLARLRAGLGERPARDAALAVHREFLDYLVDMERFDDVENYLASTRLSGSRQTEVEMTLIEFWARAGRMAESEAIRERLARAGGAQADAATLAQFRGRMESRTHPITVRERTFADLPVNDSAVLVVAMMEWSLTPNRSIRGAAPWDAVVLRFLPGFDNLPLPEDDEGAAAAAASPLY
jgi:hypothetical protein